LGRAWIHDEFSAIEMHDQTTAGEKRKALRKEALELVRLEDPHIWQMDKVKTTKKGIRSYGYWMAT
jgi:hypothetical protein